MSTRELRHKCGPSQEMCPDRYFLPCGYTQRTRPDYFADASSDGIIWQPDVYPYAAQVAARAGRDVIIDLGCGHAGKLAALAAGQPRWHFVGVDIGPNISWCRAAYQFGDWIEADLETCQALPLPADLVRRAIVVCSDVLEHLVRPEIAVTLIASLLRQGGGEAILSTPARELRAGASHPGPPRNPCHVREWTCAEFLRFLTAGGLIVDRHTLTRSDDAGGGMTTQLVRAQCDRGGLRARQDHRQ